ncbi:hypothetical protein HDZ31DRAFT_72675 [Schizophyllum fasciatum]
MDSEDEYDEVLLQDAFEADFPARDPGLKLHGGEILETIRTFHEIASYGIGTFRGTVAANEAGRCRTGDVNKLATCRGRLAMTHAYRFFDTITGFHVGSLDLSGRHPERYERLRSRFDAVEREFDVVAKSCTSPQRRKQFAGWGLCLSNPPDAWAEFANKWHLGRMMGWVDVRVCIILPNLIILQEECRTAMDEYPEPQYQKLLLLDLPFELLNNIRVLSSREELRLWSVTSRRLRHHAFGYLHQSCNPTPSFMAVNCTSSMSSLRPHALHIRNLHLTVREECDESVSQVISLCPSLAFLSVLAPAAPGPVTGRTIRALAGSLAHSLRRIHIFGLRTSSLSTLTRALALAAAAPAALTHLSLTAARGAHVTRTGLLHFVRALRYAQRLLVFTHFLRAVICG